MPTTNLRIAARIDLVLAVIFGAFSLWLFYDSSMMAADAVRRYGHNVDAGAVEYVTALLYAMPVALSLAFAAFGLWRVWRIRWYIHWLAAAGTVLLTIWMRF